MMGMFTDPSYYAHLGPIAQSAFIREGHNTVKEKRAAKKAARVAKRFEKKASRQEARGERRERRGTTGSVELRGAKKAYRQSTKQVKRAKRTYRVAAKRGDVGAAAEAEKIFARTKGSREEAREKRQGLKGERKEERKSYRGARGAVQTAKRRVRGARAGVQKAIRKGGDILTATENLEARRRARSQAVSARGGAKGERRWAKGKGRKWRRGRKA